MALRLRLRGPSGGAAVNLSAGASLAELCALAAKELALDGSSFEFLTGHPPKSISGVAELQSGDTLIVRPAAAAAPEPTTPVAAAAAPPPTTAAAAPPAAAAAAPSTAACKSPPAKAARTSPPASATGGPPQLTDALDTDAMDEDAMLAQAIALSQGGAVPPPPQPTSYDGGEPLVRRVVPADNSCLFVALAQALEGGNRKKAPALRELVATAVLADPEQYSEAVLGKPPHAYAAWIRDKDSWGGGIELAVLASHYKTELAAFDCQSGRVDVFGQGCGFAQRVLLIYDGIHYDLLAKTPFADAPPDFDVSVFDAWDEAVMAEGKALAAKAKQAGKYTDTASFTLRCLVCQRGLTGQAEAVEHAKQTGHTNFSEFK